MDILIVSQYFYPEAFRINDFAVGLKELGHDVEVLTGFPNYPEGKIYKEYKSQTRINDVFNGIKLIRVPLIPRGKSRFTLAFNYLSFVISSCINMLFRCKKKYDVVLVFMPSPPFVAIPGIIYKYIYKTPVCIWVQDLWPESLTSAGFINSNFIIKPIKKFMAFVYKMVDIILVQSKVFKEYISSGFNVDENKIVYLPNFAEDFYSNIPNIHEQLATNDTPTGFRIMFAGNLGEAQSLNTIIEAAKLTKAYSSIKWILIGDGTLKPFLEKQIETNQLQDTMYLLERKPADQMPKYFAVADVLLVTLKKDYIFSLTIPSKVQSYLACGKPILAAIDGETAKLISENNAGIVGPAEDAVTLAKNAILLNGMSNDKLLEMGFNGKRYFEENFKRKIVLEKFNELIKNIEK